MNPKYRALLWEECRVGGSLTLVCLAIGLCGLGVLYDGGLGYGDVGNYGPRVVFGIPILLCLVLTLQTSNSGQLTTEFSPRILRLPVLVWPVVGLIFSLRLAMVVGTAGLLSYVSTRFLGQEILVTWFLLAGVFYIYLQTLGWMRFPAPSVALLGYSLLILAVLWQLWNFGVRGETHEPGWWQRFFPVLFLVSVSLVLSYGVNVWTIHAARHGVSLGSRRWGSLPTALPWPSLLRPRRFATPLAAQVWWEIRTDAFRLPLYTVIIFVLFAVVWIPATLLVKNEYTGVSPFTLDGLLVLGPRFAMMLAAAVRAVARFRVPFCRQPAFQPPSSARPLTPAEMAAAKLGAFAISLALTLLLVIIVSDAALLLLRDATEGRLLLLEFSAGIVTLREILGYLFGLFVLYAVFAWALSESRSVLLFGCAAWYLCVIPFLGMHSYDEKNWRFDAPGIGVFFLMLALFLPAWGIISLMLVSLARVRMKNLFPPRHLLYCLAAWAALALFFFPFGHVHPEYLFVQIILSVALTSGAVLPYPILTLALQRRQHGPIAAMDIAGHRRRRTPLEFRSFVPASAGAIVLIGFLAWLRWPHAPGYEVFLRAQGGPVTWEDLEAFYPAVPPEKNLALRYQEIGDQFKAKEEKYAPLLPMAPPRNRKRYVLLDWHDFSPGILVSKSDWNTTFAYYESVVQETSGRLQAVAQSGLFESRYPFGYTYDPDGIFSFLTRTHLTSLRRLSGALNLETLVLSIEDQPARLTKSFLALAPLANSLTKEPALASQTCRMMILANSAYAFERAINCVILSPFDLARLQKSFYESLRLGDEAMKTGLTGECISSLREQKGRRGWVLHAYWGVCLPFFEQFGSHSQGDAIEGGRIVLGAWLCNGLFDSSSAPRDSRKSNSRIDAKTMAILPDFVGRAYFQNLFFQARLGQAVVACAVEEFRLAHGVLPENLQALVPEFLSEVPADPVTDGKPLSYKTLPNGGYTIYSVGLDRVNDGGIAKSSDGWQEGDMAFTVAPPGERHPPRIVKQDSTS